MTAARALGIAALVLGALAAVVGSATPPGPHQAGDEDRVAARDLAAWLAAKKDGLRVIDVRPNEAFEAYHIPGAEDVPLASLEHVTFSRAETIVLYADTEARAEQAWLLLRARGLVHVYLLRDGLAEWPGAPARRRGC